MWYGEVMVSIRILITNPQLEDKHPGAKPYFLQSNFNLKEKRQELSAAHHPNAEVMV